MNINRTNLKRAIKHMKTVPAHLFDMSTYESICGTTGCVLGHCLILDKDNVRENHTYAAGITFTSWGADFFGIPSGSDVWDFLFSSDWDEYSKAATTKKQAIRRMKFVLKHGDVPDDWDENYEYIVSKAQYKEPSCTTMSNPSS